ncbi:hypothetical protein CMI46_02330 [Candidatus Pacearchaeota archaeon]|nr:hypothetical protein [Candidatus Pacearchaeota archaeon]
MSIVYSPAAMFSGSNSSPLNLFFSIGSIISSSVFSIVISAKPSTFCPFLFDVTPENSIVEFGAKAIAFRITSTEIASSIVNARLCFSSSLNNSETAHSPFIPRRNSFVRGNVSSFSVSSSVK